MVNEDIVTVLRNAVNSGDSLQQAIQVLINSGYDSSQVLDASKYIQGGSMQNLQPKSNEQLIMAQDNRLFNRTPSYYKAPQQPYQNQQFGQISKERMQSQQHMQQAISMNKQMNQQNINQSNKIQPDFQLNKKDQFTSNLMDQNELQQLTQPIQQKSPTQKLVAQQQNIQQNQQQRSFQYTTQGNNQNQFDGIKLKNKSYKKEIILLVILVFLIGVLGFTIFFRDNILTFLSG